MRRYLFMLMPIAAICLLGSSLVLTAAEGGIPGESTPDSEPKSLVLASAPLPTDEPALKVDSEGRPNPTFLARHEAILKRGKAGSINLLFVGDSITQGWETAGKAVWKKYYEPLQAANFGVSGDRTEHVLWRIANGELDGLDPKVVILLIGTNNSKSPEGDIMRGVRAIVTQIRTRLPHGKLLLLGLFPRGAEPKNKLRGKFAYVNKDLAKLDGRQQVRFLDLGPEFLDPKGRLPKEIMPDALHPSASGYARWAAAMDPLLTEMLAANP